MCLKVLEGQVAVAQVLIHELKERERARERERDGERWRERE